MDVYLWHRDPKRKNFYQAEIDLLKRGLSGDFELIELPDPSANSDMVKVLGYLKFSEEAKQLVEIIFPPKYPYAPPKIIPYQTNPTNILQTKHPVSFGKGNQFNDQSMCLFEKHTWGKPEHGIGWLLRRAQKWLASAHSPEGFKKEEIVEERLAVLPHAGQVLIPKAIEFPNQSERGTLTFTQVKPGLYLLETNIVDRNPFSLKVSTEQFQWFRLPEGLTLKKILNKDHLQDLHNLLFEYFRVDLLNGPQVQNIALHFIDDDPQWHFFRIFRQGQSWSFQYFLCRNISEELYLRTKYIFDDKILSQKHVTIIGLGALGSEVGKSLAKNAVGHFSLFDNDSFEIGNLVRHAADLFFLGEAKTEVLRQLIQRANPNMTVESFNHDIMDDTGILERQLSKSDLCIVLTGEDSVDYMMNDQYIPRFDIPFVFARVSPGAASGSIQIVDKESPCLRCLSLKGKDTLPKPNGKVAEEELEIELGSCSRPAVPGSEVDTKEVALQVTRISLQLLLGNNRDNYPPLQGKQFYWYGPYGSAKKEPYSWSIHNYKKTKDCSVCG